MLIRFNRRRAIFSAIVAFVLLSLSVGNRMIPTANADGNPLIQSPLPPTQVYRPTVEPQAIGAPREPIPAQVIIQFAPDATEKERAAYIESVGGTVLTDLGSLDTVVITVSEDVAQAPLPESPVVAETEPDYFVSALDFIPNDPRYAEQWALPAIGAPSAWEQMPADAPRVTVAVIDSGICASHPDLAGRIVDGWDFLDGDAVPQDDFGHGCSVSGVIAANMNDGTGIAGIAPNAQIMPLRVLNASGLGSYSDVAAAIVHAAENGAQVINLSIGGSNPSSTLENAVNYAVSKGVIVVAAAGNHGTEGALYPAAYPDVIAVGSVDPNLQHSSFSNYGSQIDLWAPGRDILTTNRDGTYKLFSGTSFAAPYVAGARVIMLATGREISQSRGVIWLGTQPFSPNETPTVEFTATEPEGGLTPSGDDTASSLISVGACAVVTNSTSAGGLAVRSGPASTYSLLKRIPDGTVVRITGGPASGSGLTWWQHDQGGWSAESYNGIRYLTDTSCGGNPGNIYVASDIELVSDPNHSWPPYEGDKLIGRFTLGNNGGQTLRLEGYGIRMRRNGGEYWDFLNTNARDLAPGQTVRFDQNNERPLATGHYRAEITWKVSGRDWQVTSAREFDVVNRPNPGNIYIASDIELVSDPNHAWPPYEGDKLIGRFTLGNNGGQTLRLEGFGIRMRRNGGEYWDFLNTTARDLAPGQTVRFDQNNERSLAIGHYRAEITWKISGQDWQVTSSREFDVVSRPNPGHVYIASDIELVSDPNHAWPPYEGDKLIGRFTLGNNGEQTLQLDGYGIRMRRNGSEYWDFLNMTGTDLAPGQTVRFDQNNERSLAAGHYRAEITWKVSGQDWQVTSAREFDVEVVPTIPEDHAIVIDQSNSPTVTPDQHFQIWFDLQNAGWSTWTSAGNYYLENTNGMSLGAPSQLDIGASVPYQSNYRWMITMQAPATIGSYTTQWRMSHGGIAFGPTLSITVTVANASTGVYDLRVIHALSFNPSSPNVAQAVTGEYTVHNFGSQTAYLRLLGIGGRGPNGNNDIEDYPWLENIGLAPGADLTISKTRGFAQGGIYTFFPVYQLSDGTWHELYLQSGASARKTLTVADSPGLQSFDIVYQDPKTKDIMPVTIRPTSYPADGSIIADVSIKNTQMIPMIMYITRVGNISQASGYLEKAILAGTIPVGSDSTVTFHDVRFYPGSHVSVIFAPLGFGSERDNVILGAYHVTEILSIAVLGWVPSGDQYKQLTGLLDSGIDQIATAAGSVNLDWFNFGQKLGRGDFEGALTDLVDLGIDSSDALSTLSGKILNTPISAALIKQRLTFANVFLRVFLARDYLRDLYHVSTYGAVSVDISPSTRPASAQANMLSVSDAAVDPLNLAALENGASVFSTSSEHVSGWEQHRMIDSSSWLGWGSANDSPTGQWSVIRLANQTPALLSSIAINPGPVAGDPSSAAINDFHVDASIDGLNFTTILTGTFSPDELGQMKTFQPDPVVAEYIRVVVDSNQGDQNLGIFSVAELDVRGTPFAPDDEFEPDATYVQATPIYKDLAQPHTLSFPGDEDYFRFHAQANLTYRIATIDLGVTTDTVLDLYDQDGLTLLRSNDNANGELSSAVIWSAPSDGYYFLSVHQQDPAIVSDSEYYSINIGIIPPPGNDNLDSPLLIGNTPYSMFQDTWSATTPASDPIPGCGPDQNSNSVWYRYTAPANGLLEIDTSGSDYDTVLAVWSGYPDNLSLVDCVDDSYGYLPAWLENVPVTGGTTYYIEVMDYGMPEGGYLQVYVNFAPSVSNDDFNSPAVIGSDPFQVTLDTRGATKASDDPTLSACNRFPGEASVWYRYIPSSSGEVKLDTIGSDYDTMLAVWTGTRGALTSIGCNDDIGDIDGYWDQDSVLMLTVSAGTTYYIEASMYAGMIDVEGASLDQSQSKPDKVADEGNLSSSLLQAQKTDIDQTGGSITGLESERRGDVAAQFWGGMLELHVSFTYNITGNAGVGGAVLSYTDGVPRTVTADGDGVYTIPVPSGWSGTVTPAKPGYAFSPASRSYSSVATHLTGQDYIATAIPPDSYEADNTPDQANVISPGSSQTHNITPAADVDWVKFTLNTASAVTLETSGATLADTQLWLYASSDLVNPLGFNNDKDSANQYSYLAYDCNHALPAGTYYVRIDEFNNDNEIPQYQINLTATACFSTATFDDVPTNYWAWSFIGRLYAAGITGGCGTNPMRYCPEETVTRAQMAVFLLRGIHTSAYAPPAIGPGTGFGDVPIDYWSGAWIKQLAAEGITTGCGNGNYCPEHPVTRGQMAVFLLRSRYGASYMPPAAGAGTGFGDVPTDYWSAAWIKQLVTEGITTGCGSGNYCPENPVTRAQMAVFLVRTFGLP